MHDKSTLFDAKTAAALAACSIRSGIVAHHGITATHAATGPGPGIEFSDVRAYAPGDDAMRIDPHLLRRTDRCFVRQFTPEQHLDVHVLLDHSGSMALPAPVNAGSPTASDSSTTSSKDLVARRLAAALAWLAGQEGDHCTVWPFAEDAEPNFPVPGSTQGFHDYLSKLATLPNNGVTDAVGAIERLAGRRLRPGLCIVISDGLDLAGPHAVHRALQRLANRHTVWWLLPKHDGAEQPPATGELQVIDCETGAALPVLVDAQTIARYSEAHRTFHADLADQLRRLGGMYAEVSTAKSVAESVVALLTPSRSRHPVRRDA